MRYGIKVVICVEDGCLVICWVCVNVDWLGVDLECIVVGGGFVGGYVVVCMGVFEEVYVEGEDFYVSSIFNVLVLFNLVLVLVFVEGEFVFDDSCFVILEE